MSGDELSPSASTTTAAAVSCSAAGSIPSPPPQDLVGSPSSDVPEIQSLTSEDDHDQVLRLNLDHGSEQPVRAAVLSEDLKRRIIKQVEYYFSDENLPTDKHLLGLIKRNKEGFVPLAIIASFKRMKKLTQDHSFITAALRESSVLVVSRNGKKVKRLNPISLPETRDPKLFTILVENLPEDHSKENIKQIFGAVGRIRSITICDPHAVDKLGKSSKVDVLISNKLHALVEYETLEASEKAVATLNDEQDWRNGLRVKLLKHLNKHAQRKQHWKGPDPEKNSTGRLVDHSCPEKNSTGQPTDKNKNSTGLSTDHSCPEKNSTGRPTDQNKNSTGRLTNHSCPEKNSSGRPTDQNKNSSGRPTNQNGDEEIQNITEHHDDVPNDEESDHQHKDKHGHKGRNQGRNRRQKYKSANGMGHGTATSAHHIELSKPPPGPKMPDGTRGFTMGRGRPPISNQSS